MKAVDTNILARLLMNDDLEQAATVRGLLTRAESRGDCLLVTAPVVLEIVWVLGFTYECPRPVILDAIERLTLMPVFRFEKPERVKEMIRLGRTINLDLADILIALTALDAGCETTLTFDRKAAKSGLFELVDREDKEERRPGRARTTT